MRQGGVDKLPTQAIFVQCSNFIMVIRLAEMACPPARLQWTARIAIGSAILPAKGRRP